MGLESIRAFLLVGGLGTRLRSVVQDRPKAMALINGRPFLEYQIDLLRACRIREFVLCVGHMRESITEHFGDGAKWGVHIEYSVERQPLGTGGALKNAQRYVNGPLILMNGDTYLDVDYGRLVEYHLGYSDDLVAGTLGVVKVEDCSRFGTVEWEPETAQVKAFREKKVGRHSRGWINAGAYVLEPSVLEHIPAGRPTSLEHQVFPTLQRYGALRACPLRGTFVDIGTPEGYRTLDALLTQPSKGSQEEARHDHQE